METVPLTKEMAIKNVDSLILIDQTLVDNPLNIDAPWMSGNFLVDLEGKWKYSFIALNNCQIIGFLICSIKSKNLHIHRFAVLPEYQQKKIGTSLIQCLFNKCSGSLENAITLKVSVQNLKAQRFYEYHGFRRVSSTGFRFIYIKEV